ncbi:MAG: lysophospholipid acyltransferase family protein [bacterium]|nr:lysophospholipid acyltransferase family protein [bacterium]
MLDLPRQAVYFANHSSHLDFLTLWAVLPGGVRERVRPIAAADYWGSGLRGRIATALFHPYLVDRGKGSSHDEEPEAKDPAKKPGSQLDGMLAVLDAGDSLVIFPEGTRGDGHEIAPFQRGLARLARERPHVPVIPVGLANLGRMLPKGGVIPVPMLATISFLPSIELQPDESDEDFLERARLLLVEAVPNPADESDAELAGELADSHAPRGAPEPAGTTQPTDATQPADATPNEEA